MSIPRVPLICLLTIVASVACGSAPAPAPVPVATPTAAAVPPPEPTAYDALRAGATAWRDAGTSDLTCADTEPVRCVESDFRSPPFPFAVAIGSNSGCTEAEKKWMSAGTGTSAIYYSEAQVTGTPSDAAFVGPVTVHFISAASVAFNGSTFSVEKGDCETMCCDSRDNCEDYNDGCLPGYRRKDKCWGGEGSWTNKPYDLARTATYPDRPEMERKFAEESVTAEILWTADSLSVACRDVTTPMGPFRQIKWQVLGTPKAVRLRLVRDGGSLPGYTLIDEVLAGSSPAVAAAGTAGVATPVPASAPASVPAPAASTGSSQATTPPSSSSAASQSSTSKAPASKPARARPPRR